MNFKTNNRYYFFYIYKNQASIIHFGLKLVVEINYRNFMYNIIYTLLLIIYFITLSIFLLLILKFTQLNFHFDNRGH